jgi:hypothetical protein
LIRGPMARFTFFFGALLTLAVCFPVPGPERVFAMGSKSGLDQIHREEKQKEQTGRDPEKDKGTEKGVQKGSPGGKEEKSPPEKKPRLKYRDPYECGC